MSTTDVRDYYRTITEQDIANAARELLGARVIEEKGTLQRLMFSYWSPFFP